MDNENVNNVPNVDDTVNKSEVDLNNAENNSATSQPVIGENQNQPGNDNVQNLNNTVQENTENLSSPTEMPSSDGNEKKKKSRGLLIGIIALVAVVVLAIAFVIYSQLMNNPTKIIKKSINDLYEKFSNGLNEIEKNSIKYNLKEDTIKLNGDIKLGGEVLKDLENSKVQFAGGLDYKNKKAEVYGNLIENDKDIIDATLYLKDNHSYVNSNTALNNIYDLGESDFSEMFDLESIGEIPTLDDIDSVVKEAKNALIDSLDSKQMSKGNTKIDINGTSVKVKSYSYKVNKESIKGLFSSISNNLANNDKFIDTINKMTEVDKETIKKQLKDLGRAENYNNITGEGSFIIYTTGFSNKYVGCELSTPEGKLVYYDYKDNVNISLVEDGKTTFEIVSTKNKDAHDIRVNYDDNGKKTELAQLTVRKYSSEEIDLDYVIKAEGQEINGTMKVTAKKENDKKISNTLSLSAKMQGLDVALNLNYAIEIGSTIADVDTSKALNINNMTLEDSTKMQQAMQNFQNSKVYQYINSLSGMTSDDTSLDMNV